MNTFEFVNTKIGEISVVGRDGELQVITGVGNGYYLTEKTKSLHKATKLSNQAKAKEVRRVEKIKRLQEAINKREVEDL